MAGATGIDWLLLVVAADEGVMPQTREHVAIADLLGIDRGVVALTKCDKLKPMRRAQRVRVLKQAIDLPKASVIPTSAQSGDGVQELWSAIEARL